RLRIASVPSAKRSSRQALERMASDGIPGPSVGSAFLGSRWCRSWIAFGRPCVYGSRQYEHESRSGAHVTRRDLSSRRSAVVFSCHCCEPTRKYGPQHSAVFAAVELGFWNCQEHSICRNAHTSISGRIL